MSLHFRQEKCCDDKESQTDGGNQGYKAIQVIMIHEDIMEDVRALSKKNHHVFHKRCLCFLSIWYQFTLWDGVQSFIMVCGHGMMKKLHKTYEKIIVCCPTMMEKRYCFHIKLVSKFQWKRSNETSFLYDDIPNRTKVTGKLRSQQNVFHGSNISSHHINDRVRTRYNINSIDNSS